MAFSDAFTGSLSRASGKNIGNYSITQGDVALNANYTLSYVGANLTIAQRPITVTASANTKTYDGTTSAAALPTITSGTLATGDVAVFNETYDNKNQGSGKTMILTLVSIVNGSAVNMAGNYNVALTNSVDGIINTRPIIVTASANTKTYNGTTSAAALPTITSGTLAAGDVAVFSETYDNPNQGNGKTMIPAVVSIVDERAVNMASNYNVTLTNSTNGVINLASTTNTLITSAESVRYMDNLTMTAQIKPLNTGSALTGTVTFSVNGVPYGTVTAVPIPGDPFGTLQATVIPQISNLPGSYTVTAIFTSRNSNYSESTNTKPLTVVARTATPYTATGFYTGDLFAWTTSASTSTATVTLVAAVKDANSPTGDVRGAKVTFYYVNGSTLTPIPSAQNLPVGLIDINDGSAGTASAIVQLNIGSGNAGSFQIAMGITGAYTNNPASPLAMTIVTVSRPIPAGYIAGGGEVNNLTSTGLIKGHSTLNTGYQFDIQYTKSGSNPKGKVNVIVRSYYKTDGTLDSKYHTYLINTNAIALLNAANTNGPTGTGTFSAKANLAEQLEDFSIVAIEGGSIFQMVAYQSGCTQQIAITLYRKAGGVWFSSNWDAPTASTKLKGVTPNSRVSVSGGGDCPGIIPLPTARTSTPVIAKQVKVIPVEPGPFNVIAYPNPSNQYFNVEMKGDSIEKVDIIVYDVLGRTIKHIESSDGQFIRFGDDLPTGAYFARISQGINQKTVRLIKQ